MNSQSMEAQERDFLCTVALNAMMPLAKERTLQAGFHILRGRKANQTVQDVHLYSLYPYYRLFPRMAKEGWENILSFFRELGYIREITATEEGNGKPSFFVTEAGRKFADERYAYYELDKWFQPFGQALPTRSLEIFWQRLHLVVQSISHMLAVEMNFYPVVRDRQIQTWVKRQIGDPAKRERWKQELGEELWRLWEVLPEDVQQLLVAQLSGVSQVGKTIGQLALQRRVAPSFLHVQFRYGLAVSMERVQRESSSFPLLSHLAEAGGEQAVGLSESAARTYALVQRGLPKEEIARIRRIKESTVEDHLAEIALRCPEWDCSDLLPDELAVQIVRTSEQLGTNRLRLIKDHLQGTVSYLQIRLALARRQEGKQRA